jgi:hypothetical protein
MILTCEALRVALRRSNSLFIFVRFPPKKTGKEGFYIYGPGTETRPSRHLKIRIVRLLTGLLYARLYNICGDYNGRKDSHH